MIRVFATGAAAAVIFFGLMYGPFSSELAVSLIAGLIVGIVASAVEFLESRDSARN